MFDPPGVPPPVDAIVIPPELFVMVIFDPAVSVARLNPDPLPISNCPFVGVAVLPVPPFPVGNVPVTAVVRLMLDMVLLEPLIVLLVRVSEPANVANVPVVGSVTAVLPESVKPRL